MINKWINSVSIYIKENLPSQTYNSLHNDLCHDFILHTKSGIIILLETKSGDRDNSDSAGKCRLENEWKKQAGKDFAYFMVFDKKEIENKRSSINIKRGWGLGLEF